MAANRTTLLGVAAAAAVFRLCKWYDESSQNRRVQKEKEEIEQHLQKQNERFAQRLQKYSEEQEQRKQKLKPNSKRQHHDDETGMYNDEAKAVRVEDAVAKQMIEILWQIYEKAQRNNKRYRNTPFDLPLLSESNSPVEIVVGAAAAIGNPDILEFVLQKVAQNDHLAVFPPGLALTKLTPDSVNFIQREFVHASSVSLGCAFSPPQDAADVEILQVMVTCGRWALLDGRLERGEPVIVARQTEFAWNAAKLWDLRAWLKKVGLHITMDQDYQQEVEKKEGKKILACYPKKNLAVPRRGASLSLGEEHFITNQPRGAFTRDLHNIITGTKVGKPKMSSPKFSKIEKPTPKRALELCRTAVISSVLHHGGEALNILKHHSKKAASVPLETLVVFSGCEDHWMFQLNNNRTIDHEAEMNSSKLVDILKSSIPPPTKDCGQIDEIAFDAEVSHYVQNYVELVRLVCCEVPRLGGAPPSKFATQSTTVWQKAFGADAPRAIEFLRQQLEKSEQERLIASRGLTAPSPIMTALLFSVLSLGFGVACLQAMLTFFGWCLRFFGLAVSSFIWSWMSVLVFRTASLVLGMTNVGHTLLILFQTPLCIPDEQTSCTLETGWRVVACLIEVIHRKCALMFGQPTPFELQIVGLKRKCRQQQKIWRARAAERDYREVLKRRRITEEQFLQLIDALTENVDEDGTQQEIVLPGPNEDAKAFLELQIEEADDVNESTGSEDESTFLGRCAELGTKVESILGCSSLFTFGDRVAIQPDASFTQLLAEASPETPSSQDEQMMTTGSVISVGAETVAVHLDGHAHTDPPWVGPIDWCTRIDERALHEQQERILLEQQQESKKPNDSTHDHDRDSNKPGTTVDDNENGSLPSAAQPQPKKKRTVAQALKDGGWTLVRKKKHLCYRRRVRLQSGESREQNFTMASTPSDSRAQLNALSTLNRLNSEQQQHGQNKSSAPNNKNPECCYCGRRQPENSYSRRQLKRYETGLTFKCKACAQTTPDD